MQGKYLVSIGCKGIKHDQDQRYNDQNRCPDDVRLNAMKLFGEINEEGQTIVMVTHSVKAACSAKRVLFIKDGEVFHQLYRGSLGRDEMYQKISDTLTILATGGERDE